MQARIIDFASDKFVKTLGKIDKDDVKKFYSSLSSKFGSSSKSDTKEEVEASQRKNENEIEIEVTSEEESRAMLDKKPEAIQELSTDDIDGREDSPQGFAMGLTNSNRCRDRYR